MSKIEIKRRNTVPILNPPRGGERVTSLKTAWKLIFEAKAIFTSRGLMLLKDKESRRQQKEWIDSIKREAEQLWVNRKLGEPVMTFRDLLNKRLLECGLGAAILTTKQTNRKKSRVLIYGAEELYGKPMTLLDYEKLTKTKPPEIYYEKTMTDMSPFMRESKHKRKLLSTINKH